MGIFPATHLLSRGCQQSDGSACREGGGSSDEAALAVAIPSRHRDGFKRTVAHRDLSRKRARLAQCRSFFYGKDRFCAGVVTAVSLAVKFGGFANNVSKTKQSHSRTSGTDTDTDRG